MGMIHKDQTFFIIDYETTGVDTKADLPIEIGIVATDSSFNLVDTFESLIKWNKGDYETVNDDFFANAIHRIHPDLIEKQGKWSSQVRLSLLDFIEKHTTSRKPILLSDNIQFEWLFTEMLLNRGALIPTLMVDKFHYCGWDSSLFLEVAGVGDPIPAHRALADAGLLHSAILKSIGKLSK
jgi:oligoribonuclease (3'-5' exoribonuclease)